MSVRPTHTSSPDLVDWCRPTMNLRRRGRARSWEDLVVERVDFSASTPKTQLNFHQLAPARCEERCWLVNRHTLRSESGNDPAGACHPCAAARDSPRHLPQHVVVERLLRQQPLQPRVLLVQLLQPHKVLGPRRVELTSPALTGLDRHLKMPADGVDVSALSEQPIRLSQLPHVTEIHLGDCGRFARCAASLRTVRRTTNSNGAAIGS